MNSDSLLHLCIFTKCQRPNMYNEENRMLYIKFVDIINSLKTWGKEGNQQIMDMD